MMDVFISYASEDKEEFVFPLAKGLEEKGVKVWYDDRLCAGDYFRRIIDQALAECNYGIVVLSPSYIKKEWPQRELEGLLAREEDEKKKIIIPIFHKVTRLDIHKHLLTLAGRTPIHASLGIGQVITEILRVLQPNKKDEKNYHSIANLTPDNKYVNFPFAKNKNQYFCDEHFYIEKIKKKLQYDHRVILLGMPGVGKTSLAIEYTRCHADNYEKIIWIDTNLSDSLSSLKSSFDRVAKALAVEEHDTNINIKKVKDWLKTNKRWLLIIDNIEDPNQLADYISFDMPGDVLITSRSELHEGIEIELFLLEASIDFLYKRSGIVKDKYNLEYAEKISIELGRLPLALEYAGAYIRENQCELFEYYKAICDKICDKKKVKYEILKPSETADIWYHEPVAYAWSISLEKVRKTMPVAFEILKICAFLYSDIPEDLLMSQHFGEPIASISNDFIRFNKVLSELRKYSLIKRSHSSDKKIQIHNLLQEVLISDIDNSTQNNYLCKIIISLNVILSDMEYSQWEIYNRYFNQINNIYRWIKSHGIITHEAGQLLIKAGEYYFRRSLFNDSENVLKYAINYVVVKNSKEYSIAANALAKVLESENKYSEALDWALLARKLDRELYGAKSYEFSKNSMIIGMIYEETGKVLKAEKLFKEAYAIRRKIFGNSSVNVAEIYNHLGKLYSNSLKLDAALEFHNKALEIFNQNLNKDPLDLATTYNNIGEVYYKKEAYEDAEKNLYKSFEIWDEFYSRTGIKHPVLAIALNNMAMCKIQMCFFDVAERYLAEAYKIQQVNYEDNHTDIAFTLNNMGLLFQAAGNYDIAIKYYEKAFEIWENIYGIIHKNIIIVYFNMGYAFFKKGLYHNAKYHFDELIKISNKIYGDGHHITSKFQSNIDLLYEK